MNKKIMGKLIVMAICGAIALIPHKNCLATSLAYKEFNKYTVNNLKYLKNKTDKDYKAIEIESMIYSLEKIRVDNDKTKQKRKLVYIDLIVANKGKEQKCITSVNMFRLIDKDGEIYNLRLPEEQGSLNGLVEAGGKINGTLCFEVPNTINNFKLEIKPNINSAKCAILQIDSNGKVKKMLKNKNENLNNNDSTNKSFNIKDLSFTVHSTKVAQKNKFKQAAKGNKFVYIDLTIHNKGKTQAGITAITMFSLMDKKGAKYNLVLPEEQGSLNGLVNSGEKLRGKICFEVPKSIREFNLIVKSISKPSENVTLNIKTGI